MGPLHGFGGQLGGRGGVGGRGARAQGVGWRSHCCSHSWLAILTAAAVMLQQHNPALTDLHCASIHPCRNTQLAVLRGCQARGSVPGTLTSSLLATNNDASGCNSLSRITFTAIQGQLYTVGAGDATELLGLMWCHVVSSQASRSRSTPLRCG